MRSAVISFYLIVALSACSTYPTAREAAVYDTATTLYAVEHLGGRELNPLGVYGTILSKILILHYYKDRPQEEQDTFNRQAGAFWTAASVNNLVQVLVGPSIFISVSIGAIVGYHIYTNYPTKP